MQNLFVNAPFNLSGKSRILKNAATCDRNRHSKYNPKYMKHSPERRNQSRAADMNIRPVWSDEERVISHQTNRNVIFKLSFSRVTVLIVWGLTGLSFNYCCFPVKSTHLQNVYFSWAKRKQPCTFQMIRWLCKWFVRLKNQENCLAQFYQKHLNTMFGVTWFWLDRNVTLFICIVVVQWIMWWSRSGSQNMGVQFWATIGPALVIQLAEPRPVSRAALLLIQDLDSLWTLIHCWMWTERGCVAHHWARITLLFGRLSPALCQLRTYSKLCGCDALILPGLYANTGIFRFWMKNRKTRFVPKK